MYSNPSIQVGAQQNKEFGAVLQMDLSLVLSVAQARLDLTNGI